MHYISVFSLLPGHEIVHLHLPYVNGKYWAIFIYANNQIFYLVCNYLGVTCEIFKLLFCILASQLLTGHEIIYLELLVIGVCYTIFS